MLLKSYSNPTQTGALSAGARSKGSKLAPQLPRSKQR